MKVRRSQNRLYMVSLETCEPLCMLSSMADPAWLWHARLGHVNFQSLKLMFEKAMVVGLPKIDHPSQLCDGCLIAKQTRFPFPGEAVYRAKERLELVHADLCGPITPSTAAGNKYFLLLVDDYSRMMWVYMLTEKSKAFERFKNFKALVENEVGRRIKVLRTDRGGSFSPISSMISVQIMEFSVISLHLIHHNKMELWNAEIGQWWQWQGVCSRACICQDIFGEKQCDMQCIF